MAKDHAEEIMEEYFGRRPEEKKLLDLLGEISQILNEINDLESIPDHSSK